MKTYFLTLFILLINIPFSRICSAENQEKKSSYLRYIQTYKNLAIEQQHKYKIPASITLAQGLLESGAGQSDLARRSNNHFGIKCGSDWRGKRVYHNDDRHGECFRKYNKVADSYIDHSKFLAYRSRYSSLFKLSIYDYKGWAKGLKRCGYATDRKYSSKLIKVIEDYDLYKYDRYKKKKHSHEPQLNQFRHTIYKANGLLYVHAKYGDSLESIAEDMKISARKLRKYNELPKGYPIRANDIIYLEKKKSKADKPLYQHRVGKNESMYSISQRYGIQIKSLYKLNKKDKDFVPKEGDVLKLR